MVFLGFLFFSCPAGSVVLPFWGRRGPYGIYSRELAGGPANRLCIFKCVIDLWDFWPVSVNRCYMDCVDFKGAAPQSWWGGEGGKFGEDCCDVALFSRLCFTRFFLRNLIVIEGG